jgi:hypothetical protein
VDAAPETGGGKGTTPHLAGRAKKPSAFARVEIASLAKPVVMQHHVSAREPEQAKPATGESTAGAVTTRGRALSNVVLTPEHEAAALKKSEKSEARQSLTEPHGRAAQPVVAATPAAEKHEGMKAAMVTEGVLKYGDRLNCRHGRGRPKRLNVLERRKAAEMAVRAKRAAVARRGNGRSTSKDGIESLGKNAVSGKSEQRDGDQVLAQDNGSKGQEELQEWRAPRRLSQEKEPGLGKSASPCEPGRISCRGGQLAPVGRSLGGGKDGSRSFGRGAVVWIPWRSSRTKSYWPAQVILSPLLSGTKFFILHKSIVSCFSMIILLWLKIKGQLQGMLDVWGC